VNKVGILTSIGYSVTVFQQKSVRIDVFQKGSLLCFGLFINNQLSPVIDNVIIVIAFVLLVIALVIVRVQWSEI